MTPVASDLMTIPALFQAAVAARGAAPALGAVEAGRIVWQTWTELAEAVERLRAELVGRGVQPGDRVAHVTGEGAVSDVAAAILNAVIAVDPGLFGGRPA